MQRMLVQQSEWQAVCDKAAEETDEKAYAQPSQGADSDEIRGSDVNTVLQGVSDGFLTVLSRKTRKKHQRAASNADDGDGTAGEAGALADKVDPLRSVIFSNVTVDQFFWCDGQSSDSQ